MPFELDPIGTRYTKEVRVIIMKSSTNKVEEKKKRYPKYLIVDSNVANTHTTCKNSSLVNNLEYLE